MREVEGGQRDYLRADEDERVKDGERKGIRMRERHGGGEICMWPAAAASGTREEGEG